MIRSRLGLAACGFAIALASCSVPDKTEAPPVLLAVPSVKDHPKRIERGAITAISFENFFARHQSGKVLVFDARSVFFYQLGHIPGSINLPHNAIPDRIRQHQSKIKSALANGSVIVTYCTGETCPDALALANRLSALGYPVSVFSGGWHAWNDADLPTE